MLIQNFGAALATTAVAIALSAAPAAAQRAETTKRADLEVTEDCIIAPLELTEAQYNAKSGNEQREIFGALFAGLAGTVIQTGVSALGGALEKASKERGFIAQGHQGLYLHKIAKAYLSPQTGVTLAEIVRPRRCLRLSLNSTAKQSPKELSQTEGYLPLQEAIDGTGFSVPADKEFHEVGGGRPPALYVEAHILPIRGGVIVQPMVVWYNERFSGASRKASRSELHVNFALPSADNPYAVARMTLPKIAPGTVLNWKELEKYTSLIVAPRPNANDVEKELAATNVKLQKFSTASIEKTKADRALTLAKEKLDAARAKGEGVFAAEQVVKAAQWTKDDADVASSAAFKAARNATKSYETGATNITARFVIIKDANKFGLAVASALKGQAETLGNTVKTELTPTPDWTAADTTYISAMTAVQSKQSEYDRALADGKDAATLQTLADALVVLKAKANEAAVGVNKPLPFPNLTFLN